MRARWPIWTDRGYCSFEALDDKVERVPIEFDYSNEGDTQRIHDEQTSSIKQYNPISCQNVTNSHLSGDEQPFFLINEPLVLNWLEIKYISVTTTISKLNNWVKNNITNWARRAWCYAQCYFSGYISHVKTDIAILTVSSPMKIAHVHFQYHK
jgi:hypothetical protein